MRPLFAQERVATSAGLFLEALLGPERRKTGWMRAEAAGDPGPWRQQALLGRTRWEADALRAAVVEPLADPDAVLVLEETGFLKQGVLRGRPAVHRLSWQDHQQPDRRLRRLCLRPGPRLRALYLPRIWTDDPARMAAAHVRLERPSPPSLSLRVR